MDEGLLEKFRKESLGLFMRMQPDSLGRHSLSRVWPADMML